MGGQQVRFHPLRQCPHIVTYKDVFTWTLATLSLTRPLLPHPCVCVLKVAAQLMVSRLVMYSLVR